MTGLSAGRAAVEPAIPLVVRTLDAADDYAACVRLQREIWGLDFADFVPASLLKISQWVGGVTVGAFTPEGQLVGFVYGLTGVREGKLVHWSHMLGVQAEYRNRGLGRRLKERQREQLQGQGIEMIYWTFDPLVARNAHLNLNRLGTQVREYVPDMYGDTGSPLHAFGTDRLVVAWPVSPGAPRLVVNGAAAWRQAPVVGGIEPVEAGARRKQRRVNGGHNDGALLRIEVPADVESMPVGEARKWRAATRTAFLRLLGEGYRVVGFVTEEPARSFYVLAAPEAGLSL